MTNIKYWFERNTDAQKLGKSKPVEQRGEMLKQELKKIVMVAAGVGGAYALYKSTRQERTNSI